MISAKTKSKKHLGLLLSIPAFLGSSYALAQVDKPKLILQITIDQLRGDMPTAYLDRMGKGGFRYLLNEGVVYKDAHHNHANTETIVGHATLATGALPAVHGMIGNVWFDDKLQRLVYNVEDSRYPLLSVDAGVNQKTEIDPTQRTAKSSGRSPTNIQVSTFSDELMIASNGKAKVFGVSVKDRGAISMAGHMGKAFWFSKKSGEFVTSSYYYDKYPDWVTKWNQAKPATKYDKKAWQLSQPQKGYVFARQDEQVWESKLPGFGRTFPHQYGDKSNGYFNTFLTLSPAGDELTLDFAKAVVNNEQLGQDDVTDYLSVSFSSTDYVGHMFGPSSLEAEDNMLRLDRTIAKLVSFIDKKVGLDNTLIVLSADHGAAEAPAYLSTLGMKTQVVAPKTWDKKPGMQALKKKFGFDSALIKSYFHPYIYLDRDLIARRKLSLKQVQKAVATELEKFNGVALAVTSSDIEAGNTPQNYLHNLVVNNHSKNRSGDVYIVLEAHRFVADMEGLTVATTHGSPWGYDTFVPLIFAGFNIDNDVVYDRVSTTDIAVTLSAILGIKAPSGAQGQILEQVFDTD
ncbi:alkaline phosphatase family protein [Colwellia psychrerythraea]|uniref:Type I phosphodiesterase/nucleotide pyrophosphatase n=1 Tax=Colwellia psychrerythraea TaxID=28229 RepID=A0A099L7Q9_COLPS|nr:alkaline phosphatase family protein [Colwellia psychrerythraea]KGJ97933.1 type I phosphodiesterase/nucleotide pyrophosphatase [Colwellia psychrerythraea]